MKRRSILQAGLAGPLLTALGTRGEAATAPVAKARVRPGDAGWPSDAAWSDLDRRIGGRLLKPRSPFAACPGDACDEALRSIKSPFYLGDQVSLTQTSGWIDAWRSQPSAYAIAAESTADVVAAVDFARRHRLRLVVKGGGHSYHGTSNAADSLLVWTRRMDEVTMHDAFVAQGCHAAPQAAVSIGAGALWIDAYTAVTTRGGRYVQGGGCTTVGVAGLVQSGGFGNFSKRYGTAAAGLIEAEIVTADGRVRIVNACRDPELFWAIKGGGGGSLGVVTRLTLRTHPLPAYFGAVFGRIVAANDEAYRALVARMMEFYRDALLNPHWGEQISLHSRNVMQLSLVFHDLDQQSAEAVWAPFVEWVRARSDYSFAQPLRVLALPARHFWDVEFFREHGMAQLFFEDDRSGAPKGRVAWAGDLEQVGWFIHGYQSTWLPEDLLHDARRDELVDALVLCAKQWSVGLHFNKGLAGAPRAALDASRDTATNPQVLTAFALAIVAGNGPAAFTGMPTTTSDPSEARADAASIDLAIDALRRIAPGAGAYLPESDYSLHDWQIAYWGANHARLATVKRTADPDGLFFVHHGVGSESWSDDGFVPVGR